MEASRELKARIKAVSEEQERAREELQKERAELDAQWKAVREAEGSMACLVCVKLRSSRLLSETYKHRTEKNEEDQRMALEVSIYV